MKRMGRVAVVGVHRYGQLVAEVVCVDEVNDGPVIAVVAGGLRAFGRGYIDAVVGGGSPGDLAEEVDCAVVVLKRLVPPARDAGPDRPLIVKGVLAQNPDVRERNRKSEQIAVG